MSKTKSIFVSIIGKPNVGKSSLLNLLLGEKIAIVSHRPQTTRTKITGILTDGDTQMVFFDTPGMHKAKTKLGSHMVKTVKSSVSDVDLVLLVLEANRPLKDTEEELLASLKLSKTPVILIMNKIDTVKNKEDLLEQIAKLTKNYKFEAVVPMSALKGEGKELLIDEIKKLAIDGPHFFESDSITDQPEKVIVAEIIREKILKFLFDEIPHGTAVEIEKMKTRKDKDILDIDCVIYCEKDSHKGMVIGKKGTMLKKIASEARADCERFLGTQIHLQCWVKVKEDWRNKEAFIKNFGLDSKI